jgi:hypothetical protein
MAVRRWEYMLLSEQDMDADELRVRLNELGDEGWEFVAVVGYQRLDSLVLKRPLEDEQGAPGRL